MVMHQDLPHAVASIRRLGIHHHVIDMPSVLRCLNTAQDFDRNAPKPSGL